MSSSFCTRLALIYLLIGFQWLAPIDLSAQGQPDMGYFIGAGDILEIQVWDNDDLHRKVEVSQEGEFTYPLIGKVHASGLSVFGLETLIKDRLADGYLVNPQVTVSVAEYKSRKVFLFGEVKKPGTYFVRRKTHILELISEAGGFADRAGRIITIVRPRSSLKSQGPVPLEEAKENEIITVDRVKLTSGHADDSCFVSEGDSIYVSEAPRIFVTGKVEKPGEFKWEAGLTVHQAIILAGGPGTWGSSKRASIVRIENGVEKELEADMNDTVRPFDIIKVPSKGFFER